MKIKTPYKGMVPPLSSEEFTSLKESVAEFGVLVPLLVDESGNLLDGHHRYKLDKNAKRLVIRGLSEEQKQAFVFRCSNNRRNLSPEQRAELTKNMQKRAKEFRKKDHKFWTQKRIAREFGISQQVVSAWLAKSASNTSDGNSSNGSASQTAKRERQYFAADARVKLSREATEQIADAVASGKTQEQVAADFKVSRQRVSQIWQREKKRREQQSQRDHAAEAPAPPSDAGVLCGDWQQLMADVADSSAELIFTDPPYHKEAVPQYAALAAFAERALVDGGSLVCYCGNGALPRVLEAMRSQAGLRYYWMCACVHTGKKSRMNRSGIINGFKPLLWFIKGGERFDALKMVEDCLMSRREKSGHRWQQSEVECEHFIEQLTQPGALVVDPFAGSGTTGAVAKRLSRRWLLCEIDPSVAQEAAGRIRDVSER